MVVEKQLIMNFDQLSHLPRGNRHVVLRTIVRHIMKDLVLLWRRVISQHLQLDGNTLDFVENVN